MKVKNLIEHLLRLPPEHELEIVHRTQYGDVVLDFDLLEVKREVKPKYALTAETVSGESYEVQGIEETCERCIMVLS